MNVKIIPAATKDIKNIQNLNSLLFKKEHSDYDNTLNLNWTFNEGAKYFADQIKNNDACLLMAKIDNKIVGYLSGTIHKKLNTHRTLTNQAELENMIVLEDYRNKQIGAKLTRSFIDWAKKKDITNIKVVASATNKQAINFYKKNGFQEYNCVLELNI